ncbi:MAG: hypothetical protein V7K67_16960 [Nostoc sp.]|uniref:hypothetical protein n=1 Tax=Nostoc sp. TaxID=1180 RepID=UPI002FF721F4
MFYFYVKAVLFTISQALPRDDYSNFTYVHNKNVPVLPYSWVKEELMQDPIQLA